MLDIGPIHVASGEFQIGLDRFSRVVWIPNDQAADNIHLILVDVVDRLDRGITLLPVFPLRVFRDRSQEGQVFIQDVFNS